ncbi:uncharacterized protein [Rutidosis leptorrhynchoides]|uniref:uncharacterized protein n=1 Tax=Rutidosis leptorrhynchoides TaxID=125765 RepID=UPI003A99D14C
MESFDNGGLNVGSLRAFNLSLMCKWLWCFLGQTSAIWANVVKAIHVEFGGLDGSKLTCSGIWSNIINAFNKAKQDGSLPSNVIRAKVGDGKSIRFWLYNWRGDGMLKNKYRRLYHLETDKNCSLADRKENGVWSWSWNRNDIGDRNRSLLNELMLNIGSISLSNNSDSWGWVLDNDTAFTVADTRTYIDTCLLPSVNPFTRWVKCVPRKINILLWRVALDKFPTRLNLSRRCLEIQQIGCVSCNYCVETLKHVLFDCNIAADLLRRTRMWVDVDLPIFSEWAEWIAWFDDWRERMDVKDKLYTIVAALIWHIWTYRNSVIFRPPMKKLLLFDSICFTSFSWYSSRGKSNVTWNEWLIKPL